MKFKKGLKVEVCSDKPGFLGAWVGGVIVSQDGFTCEVQYDQFVTDEGKPLVEKMDYSHIRPVPPDTNITNWVGGDAVEAYDNDCWWAGVVVKVLPENCFSVHFPKSCSEKAYHYSDLRSAQQWHDGKWSFALQVIAGKRVISINMRVSKDKKIIRKQIISKSLPLSYL